MTILRFTVTGKPAAKGRPRAMPRIVWTDGKPRAIVQMVTPPDTVKAERVMLDAFRAAYPAHEPFTGPVRVTIVAVFGIPISWPKALREAAELRKVLHVGRPDGDNVQKLALDSLNGAAWVDDGQAAEMLVRKRYGSPERTEITIEAIPQADIPITPGQKRLEARIEAGETVGAKPRVVRKPPKSKAGNKLQAAIAAALARDGK